MKKEEFREFDFNFIANFDIDKLSKKVSELPKEDFDGTKINSFLWNPTYQIAEVGFGDLSLLIKIAILTKKPLKPKVISKDKELWELVKPIVRYLEKMNPGKIHGTIVLSNLRSMHSIPEHRDYKHDSVDVDFLNFSNKTRRYHLVLTTNEHSFFTNGNTTISMKAGECWEINKGNVHSVKNEGDTDRLHLIIDLVPESI
jgi:hypothetical protein